MVWKTFPDGLVLETWGKPDPDILTTVLTGLRSEGFHSLCKMFLSSIQVKPKIWFGKRFLMVWFWKPGENLIKTS